MSNVDFETARMRVADLLDSVIGKATSLKIEAVLLEDGTFAQAFNDAGESDFDSLVGIEDELDGLLAFVRAGCIWEE